MANFRCELCDGRIVNNRCQDCGMDYSRRRKKYELNVSRRSDDAAAVRKVNQTSRQAVQRQKQSQNKQYLSEKKKATYPKQAKTGKAGKTGIAVSVMALVFIVMGAFLNLTKQWEEKEAAESYDLDFLDDYEYDWDDYDFSYDYDYSMEEQPEAVMPAEGEVYAVELTQGRYVGGQQLPAGTYDISLADDDPYLYGSVILDDEQNDIYESVFLAAEAEYGVQAVEGYQLFEGGVLEVAGEVKVLLETENAQMDTMQKGQDNPLTETYEIKFGDSWEAGKDIPAGFYDAQLLSGVGTLEITESDMYEYYSPVMLSDAGSGTGYGAEFKNLYLKEGQMITAAEYGSEDFRVRLSPTETVFEPGNQA